MTITLSFYGNLIRFRARRNEPSVTLQAPSGTPLSTLLDELGVPKPERHIVVLNGKKITPDHVISEGENIEIYSLSSGG